MTIQLAFIFMFSNTFRRMDNHDIVPITSLTKAELIPYLQVLISKDFTRLIQLLYRLDISESKLKAKLQVHSEQDAAETIADMILERLIEKQKLREAFKHKDWGQSEEERW